MFENPWTDTSYMATHTEEQLDRVLVTSEKVGE
jgi:hypothetical protein